MIVAVPMRNFLKYGKIGLAAVLLVILTYYLLPKLITFIGSIQEITPKIRDQQLLEKPLRVFLQF